MLSDQMNSMMEQLTRPFEDRIQELQDENASLKERLRVYQSGPAYSSNDVNRIETQLREEQDRSEQLTRRLLETETKLRAMTSKCQSLESQLQNVNSDITTNVRQMKTFEDQIKVKDRELEKMREENSIIQKERLDIIQEKSILSNQLTALAKANDELTQAVESLLDRDKEMNSILSRIDREKDAIETERNTYKDRCIRLEKRLKKLNKGADITSTENLTINENNMTLEMTSKNVEEVQNQLNDAKKQIIKQKEELSQLDELKHRLQKLNEALENRNNQIDNLRKQLDEKDDQLHEYFRSKSDLIQKVDKYRAMTEKKSQERNKEFEEMAEELKHYKEQYEVAQTRIENLEKSDQSEEITQLRKELDDTRNRIFGLPQAVSEIKELKAMVELRDQHIAELVAQANQQDKIINGLLPYATRGNSEYKDIVSSINTSTFDEERIRTEIAARDLARKIELLRQRGPPTQIKVVLKNDVAPQIVTERTPRSRRRLTNDQSPSDSSWASSSPLRKKKSAIRIKNLDNDDNNSQKESPKTEERDVPAEPPVQVIDLNNDTPEIPPEGEDRDEWVINLQRKYIQVRNERDELQRLLDALRKQLDDVLKNNEDLQKIINENQYPYRSRKSNLSFALKRYEWSREPGRDAGLNLSKRSRRRKDSSDYEYDRKRREQKALLSLGYNKQCILDILYKPTLKRVNMSKDDNNTVILPSQQERDIFEAKQNILKTELENVRQESLTYKHQLEALKIELAQQKEIRDRMQAIIDNLKKQLQDEREQHKESLVQFRNEAELYSNFKVQEAIDVTEASNRFHNTKSDSNDGNTLDLSSIRMRLAELERRNNQLDDQLKEQREITIIYKQDLEREKKKTNELTAELAELNEKMKQKDQQDQLKKYSSKVRMELKQVQKRCEELAIENERLKNRRGGEESRRMGTQHSIDFDDFENSQALESTKMPRNAEASLISLRNKNDDMQIKLGKAQGTIERLNQLLQRKETQVSKLKEQTSAYKQQLLAKQKEVLQLQNKIQSYES